MYTYEGTDNNITLANCTGTHAHILRVNAYDFTGTPTAKTRKGAQAEQAITDTVQYMGWMSLKDSEHNGTAKDISQAQERRQAADRLIAAGTVVLLGTWSNGIAVGPGAGFVACTNEAEVVAPVKAKKSRKPNPNSDKAKKSRKPNPNSDKAQAAAFAKTHQAEWDANASLPGATCDWESTWHGPAFVAKPRVRVPLATMQACSPRWVATIARDEADDTITATIEAITGEEYVTPDDLSDDRYHVEPTPIYTPSVGDTVAITYQHERMTTDRIVNVQRVAADGKTFRGYDRTYDRVRNYDMARVLTIRRLGGEGVDIAAG